MIDMPCYDPRDRPEVILEEVSLDRLKIRKERDKFQAILCGVFSHLSTSGLNFILDQLDYEEMGVTRDEIEQWWKEHQKTDAKRRAKEAETRKSRNKSEMQVRVDAIKSDFGDNKS